MARNRLREWEAAVIREALVHGERSFEQLCSLVHKKPHGFREFCRMMRIDLPDDLRPWRYRPELDKLIDLGYSYAEIGRAFGLTSPSIRKYVIESGQEAYWKRQTSKQKRDVDERERELLQIYDLAVFVGEAVPIAELGRRAKISLSATSRLLKKNGRSPLVRPPSRAKQTLFPEEREVIRRAHASNLTITDISFYSGIGEHIIRYHFGNIEQKRNPHSNPFDLQAKIGSRQSAVGYRHGSQVYSSVDFGVPIEDLVSLHGISLEGVHAILERREKITPMILRQLKTLYPHRSINVPYLAHPG